MRYSERDRATLAIYGLVLIALLVAVGIAARDVLFERFTARRGAAVVAGDAVVYAVGGQDSDGDVYASILALDPAEQRIARVGELEEPLLGFAVAVTTDGLFVVGGMRDREYTRAVYRFDPENREIERVATMPFPVAFGAAAMVDGVLYHVGGYDGDERRAEIVAIDPDEGRAAVTGELPSPRDNLCATGAAGSLFVLGGDGPGNVRHGDLIEIEPGTGTVIDEWQLPRPINAPSLAVAGGTLYALGSQSGNRDTLLSLPLDRRSGEIVRSRPVELDARSVSLVAVGETLLGVGGRHPSVARQLGVWRVNPDSRDAEPLRYHARVWY
ncbi:MAG: Kelch repeat-containing protein [Spirochaetota bacterium]